MTRLSARFQSIKNLHPPPSKALNPMLPGNEKVTKAIASSFLLSHSRTRGGEGCPNTKQASKWSVYLIVASRLPRTYVGVTTDFSRRLKQHNGELKGGAKASSAGRPWTLACIVRGFKDRSEACEFETKWKSVTQRMPRKKKGESKTQNSILQHREAALDRVKASFDCSCLKIKWQSISP